MAVAPAKIIDPVTLTPARYGLLSAADVRPGDVRTRSGVEWEDTPLGEAVIAPNDCLNTDETTVPDGIPWSASEPITVRAGFTCRSVGLTESDINGRAQQALVGVESAALEGAAWSQFTGAATDLPPLVTLPAASDLLSAVGALETYLWANYGGTPVIHAPRAWASRLDALRQVQRDGGRLTTSLGSRWAFGNYPLTGPAAAAGNWLVATGQLVLYRSEVDVKPGTFGAALNTKTNEVFSIAERTYALQIDGVRVAVQITSEDGGVSDAFPGLANFPSSTTYPEGE